MIWLIKIVHTQLYRPPVESFDAVMGNAQLRQLTFHVQIQTRISDKAYFLDQKLIDIKMIKQCIAPPSEEEANRYKLELSDN
jgi:predicted transglutaminase-like protease